MLPPRAGASVRPWSTFARQPFSLTQLFTQRRFHVYFLATLSLPVLFAKLHLGDLPGYDSAIYAHEGKQMLATGQWWSVYLNGELDFDKPPLFVWLEALSMLAFGVSDFAARFPSALLGFGTLLLVYLITRELTPLHWLPVWAMLILFSTHFFMRFAMRAMTDVPFTFLFTLALLCYLKGLKREQYFLWCGLAIGLAILMRSFLGAIPLTIIVAHLAIIGRLRLLRSPYFAAGLVLAVGLPLVWFVSQYQLHGSKFLRLHFSFTVENLPLTQGKRLEQFGLGLLQYPLLLCRSYWPWLPLMVVGLVLQFQKMWKEREAASALLVLWVVAVVASFSLAEFKWLRYLMPAFPGFAILSAFALHAWLGVGHKAHGLKVIYAVLCVVMIGLALNPKYRVRPEEMRRLAPVAEAATHPEHRILLYTERAPRYAHLFQVIWYANRYCELLNAPQEALTALAGGQSSAVIMDREVFHACAAIWGEQMQVLSETESFVCWTKSGLAQRAQIDRPVASNCPQTD